jgi:hypothetical protein
MNWGLGVGSVFSGVSRGYELKGFRKQFLCGDKTDLARHLFLGQCADAKTPSKQNLVLQKFQKLLYFTKSGTEGERLGVLGVPAVGLLCFCKVCSREPSDGSVPLF